MEQGRSENHQGALHRRKQVSGLSRAGAVLRHLRKQRFLLCDAGLLFRYSP
jgi:hypothetical protein